MASPAPLKLPSQLAYDHSSSDPSKDLEIYNPATGNLLTTLRTGDTHTANAAVTNSRQAFQQWRWRPPIERSMILHRCADELSKHVDELATLLTLENGKPFLDAKAFDLGFLPACFRHFASLIATTPTQSYDRGPLHASVLREPHGVVVAILPFNWPPIHAGGKAAPALAAGNSVILKPGDQAPLTVMRIVEILQGVLPPGLLQAVPGHGPEVPQALLNNPDVRMVSFTGSTNAGRIVSEMAGERLKHCALELGGKNAFVVCEDADLDAAAKDALEGALFNKGEACTATSRILVHQQVHDKFVGKLAAGLKKIRVGDGMDASTHVGPLVSREQQERVQGYVALAIEEGAKIAAQAPLPADPRLKDGFYIPPTLFKNVSRHMRVAQEEMFGPLATVTPFSTEDEATDIVNESPYGLTCVIYTNSQAGGWRLCRRVEAGCVFLNNYKRNFLGLPFGGIKDSGNAREHWVGTLEEFSTTKVVQWPSGLGDVDGWRATGEVFGTKRKVGEISDGEEM